MNNNQTANRTAWFSFFSNIVMAALKFVVGFFGNSYALIADAIESTGDIFSSFLVILGLKWAQRPPDKNHPYGHGKIEPLITFGVVLFLIGSAVLIIIESIHKIQTPHPAPKSYTLYFIAFIIIIKEGIFRFVSRKGKETKSTSLKADAWHHRSDAISSFCAFIGISLAVWKGDSWAQADDWAALFGSLLILYNAFLILRPALGEIMDEHLYDEFVDEIKKIGEQIIGVVEIEKCHVRKSGMRFWIDLHAHVNGSISVIEGHDIAHKIKDRLKLEFPEIEDVLVHIEPCASSNIEYQN